METSFQEDRVSFFEILADGFGLLSKRVNYDEGGFFLKLPCFIIPLSIYRQADVCNRHARRSVADFRIPGEVAHENDFIERGHKNRSLFG